MENKKSKGSTALVVLLLIVTIASLVLATYAWAKYTSTTSNNATAQVARWNVTFNNTINQDTFVGDYKHVVDQRIAPGTSGSFQIGIDATSTEVCVDYQIFLTSLTFTNNGSAININSYPGLKHIKFYRTCTGGVYSNELTVVENPDVDADNVISGSINLNGGNHNGTIQTPKVTETIYWVWPYENGQNGVNIAGENATQYDDADTKAGEIGSNTKMEVSYRIKAWQVQPGSAEHHVPNQPSTNKTAN